MLAQDVFKAKVLGRDLLLSMYDLLGEPVDTHEHLELCRAVAFLVCSSGPEKRLAMDAIVHAAYKLP